MDILRDKYIKMRQQDWTQLKKLSVRLGGKLGMHLSLPATINYCVKRVNEELDKDEPRT